MESLKKILRTPSIVILILVALASLFFLILRPSGLYPSQNTQVSETGEQTAINSETYYINNCGGTAELTQAASHQVAVSIDSLTSPLPSDFIAAYDAVQNKYSQYSKGVSIEITAPPETNMKFVLEWTESIRSGISTVDGVKGRYTVRIPISVQQVSAENLGCGQVNITPTQIMMITTKTVVPPSKSSPVEIAVLNINSEKQADGTIKNTASLSISPLGLGTLQLISPSTIKLGESGIIRLSISPDTVLSNLPQVTVPAVSVSANAPDYVLEFSDRLQIYPVMIAELKGVNFEIVSDGHPEKPVTSEMPVEWIWNVSPLSAGKQTLILSISVPVIIDQIRDVASAQTLKNIPIEVQVEVTPTLIPSKTPKPTQTPIPTSTPTPLPPIAKIGEKLIENVSSIIVAIIALIGVLAGAYVTYQNGKKDDKVAKSTTSKAKKK